MGKLEKEAIDAFDQDGERSAAKFLQKYPELVFWGFCKTGGHAQYVLSEFPLGSKWRTDLVVAFAYSGAWEIHFVELEPTDDAVITKKGVPSQRLNSAISQVNDWADFVDQNTNVRDELSRFCTERDLLGWRSCGSPVSNYSDDLLHDHRTFIYWNYHIVIGRRDNIDSKQRQKMNQLQRRGSMTIGTYDKFVDIARNHDQLEQNPNQLVRLTKHDEE